MKLLLLILLTSCGVENMQSEHDPKGVDVLSIDITDDHGNGTYIQPTASANLASTDWTYIMIVSPGTVPVSNCGPNGDAEIKGSMRKVDNYASYFKLDDETTYSVRACAYHTSDKETSPGTTSTFETDWFHKPRKEVK